MSADLVIRLSGSWRAETGGLSVDHARRRKGSPLCDLARQMIEAGHDPASTVHILRDGRPAFRPAPLGVWAGLRVREGDERSAAFVRFTPVRVNGERFTAHPASPGTELTESREAGSRASRCHAEGMA